MSNYNFVDVKGVDKVIKKLEKLSSVDLEAIEKKSTAEMYNRANSAPVGAGGTPVSTERTRPNAPHGELKRSRVTFGKGTEQGFGYTAEYAPHVEFGHRTRDGGYVSGQHFLQANFNIQVPIFKNDCLKQIRKLSK